MHNRTRSPRVLMAVALIVIVSAITFASPWSQALSLLGFASGEAESNVVNSVAAFMPPDTKTVCSTGTPDFATVALAAADANTAVPAGGRTYLVCAGHTETAPPTGIVLTAAGSDASNPISFVKDGVGTNPTINAGIGTSTPGSAAPDGIFSIRGADHITIDGFTFTDGNAANPATMEFGVALFRVAAGNGANNNTIQNCTFNMQRINNAVGSGPMFDGSVGILVVTSTATAATTLLIPTNGGTLATNGTNSGNKFYGNTINGGNYGIGLSGNAATAGVGPAPNALTFLGDIGNDVGGASAATGNTILNFGGGGILSPSAGIRANNQWSINISYNTLDNNNGSGVNHAITFRGIYAQAGTSASATINNNTVTIKSGATTSLMTGIDNGIGSTAASNTVSISNNIVNLGYAGATTATPSAIINAANAATVNIDGNTIQGISGVPLGGTGTIPLIETGSPTTVTSNSNTIQNLQRSGASGSWRGIKTTSPTNWTANNNTITNLSWTTAASTGSIDAIYSLSSAVNVTANSNSITNLSTPTTGTITGITEFGSSGLKTFQNNTISNFSTTSGGAGGASLRGISESTGSTNTISGNTIFALNSTGSSGGTSGTIVGISVSSGTTNNIYKNKIYDLSTTSSGPSVSGMTISGGTTSNIYNNLIGDLRATAATSGSADIIRGLSLTSTTTSSAINASFNTIYINATSSGASFSTSGVFHAASTTATTATLTLRNNIIVNTSTPNGAASLTTAAFRRSSGAANTFNNYGSASNNNLFYAGTPGPRNLILDDTNNGQPQTIAAYKAGVFTSGTIAPRDSASISEFPAFLSTTGSSSSFLHINTFFPTQIESGGTPVAGITDDFDGNTRNVSTPDIGADEFSGTGLDLSPPTVTYTAFGNTASLANRTLTTTIADATGVPTAGAGLPVLYWRINAGAYTPVTATYISGSTYEFTFGAGVVATDTVSYYIVAQDTAGTPNVGSSPAGGSGFTINPPAAATPPASPSTYTIVSAITGNKTICASGCDYTTLTGASGIFNAINTQVVTGNLTIEINGDLTAGEDGSVALNAINEEPSGSNFTVKIYPTGTTRSITSTTAPTGGFIRLNAADRVTIDGSIGGTGTDRSLTITEANTGTTSAVVWLQSSGSDGATNNTIKNLNIVGNSNTTTLIGIGMGSSTVGTSSLGTNNNTNTIQNNNISKTQFGIYTQGASSASKNSGNVITQNLINTLSPNNVTKGGIITGFENNLQVTQNTVSEIAQASSPDVFGITLGIQGISTSTFTGNEVTNATVSRNVVGSVRNTGTFSACGICVAPSASGTNSITNNSVYGVSANGTSGDFSVGVFIGGGTGSISQMYFNSVSMSGTQTGGSDKSYALAVGGSNPVVDIRNNVLSNTQNNGTGNNYTLGLGYSTFTSLTLNYNDYFTTTGATYFLAAIGSISAPTNVSSLPIVAGQDANSINSNPQFNSATNLQPGAGSPLILAGSPIGGITSDIIGITRDVTAPTIGAYETIADTAGPTITYTALGNTTSTGDRTINPTFTDGAGVPTTAPNRPRIYFKKSTDASYAVSRPCTFAAGTWTCTTLFAGMPSAPVVAGDTIQYFIVAQDNIGNVSSSPAGVVATDVNTVATPPTPNSYNVLVEVNTFPYTQNFESGAGGFTSGIVGGSVNDWVLGTPAKTQLSAAHSGTNAWVTKLTGSYSSSQNAAVYSPIFNFTSVPSTATISFWQNFDISGDPDWDSMVLEASTDGGTIWNRVDSTLGTGGTFDTADSTGWYNVNGANGPILGPEWTNTSTGYTGSSSGWIQSTTKVGALAGQASVLLRWRFASDSSFADEGFAIDDIAVTPAVVAPGDLQLSSATYAGNENSSVSIDVDRVSGSAGTVGISYSLTDGTATGGASCGAGVDYINSGGTLSFVDSDVLETISVSLCSDAVIDASETFTVTLSAPTGGAGLGTPTVSTVTITDVPPPFTGTYTVGSGGSYPSLTNSGGIFEALNLSGVSGQVFIEIISDLTGETGTHQLNDITAGNNITIRPNGGPWSITGSSAGSLIVINGADNVVIDGSGTDANAGPTVGGDASLRKLTIANTNTGTASAVVSIHTGTNGATNNTIKNLNVVGSSSLTGTLIGVEISGNTVGTVGADNDNNRITNCSVQKAFYGIVALGASGANPNSQNQINRNDLSATGANSIGRIGIYVANEDTVQVHENSVGGISNALSADSIGLGIGIQSVLTSSSASGNVTNGTIYRNRINGIANTNTYSAVGIAAACTSCALANNMVTGVVSDGTSGDFTAGIFVVSGTGTSTNVFHNSVAMTGDRGATAEYPSFAIAVTGTDTPVALVNNVFYTSQVATGAIISAKSYAIGIVANNINFLAEGNAYWSVGSNDGGFRTGSLTDTGNTDLADLAAWQLAISDDSLAQEVDPQFANAANDLHLTNPATNTLLNAGYNNQTPSVDFDNDPRPVTTPPQTNLPHADIGADEVVQADGGTIPAGTYYNAYLGTGESLGGNVTVTGTMYFNGIVTEATDTLTFDCNATASGVGPTAYFDGAVRKNYCSTGSFSYPVGDGGYSPVDVTITALATNPSSLTVSPYDATLSGFDPLGSLSRNWELTETGELTATLLFHYLDADVNGDEFDYRVWRREGNGSMTNLCAGSPCVDIGLNTLGPVAGVTTFSRWTGSGPLAPTAAEVTLGGRIMTSDGRGVKNAVMVLTGNSLMQPKRVVTGPFGYYQFEGLEAGETYVVTVNSKRFMFSVPSRVISVPDSVSDVDFVAMPQE